MKQRWILALWTMMVTFSIQSVILNTPVFSIAKESSLSITLQDGNQSIQLIYAILKKKKENKEDN
ncbi:hypothetical protein IJG01_00760 [Candidatus Saccharibacteria bacterium]|nr:hypothetical protein [Candidatus Saccharibacteria bacterium]